MPTAPFRYVVSDMDGTLLGSDHRMSDYTRDTLKTLVHEYGVTPILASGRSYADVKVVAHNLSKYIWGGKSDAVSSAPAPDGRAHPPALFLLTSNGAVANNGVTGEVVFQSCIDAAIAEKLFCHLPTTEEEVGTNIYQNEDWFSRIDWPEMNLANKESGIRYLYVPNPPPRSADPVPPVAPDVPARGVNVGNYDNISKVFYITDDAARLPPLAEEVQAMAQVGGGNLISLTFSATDCMDIMAEGVCKGQALRKLFSVILEPKQGADVVEDALKASIAFGDGLNDAEMLTEVGKGCMMGNSNPKLKELLPDVEVVLPNSDDGVAKKLRSVFGIPL